MPGALGNESSASFDSFQESGHGEGLLDCPHWTHPPNSPPWITTRVGAGYGTLTVADPTPSIDTVNPSDWTAGDVQLFTLTGSGFGSNPRLAFTGDVGSDGIYSSTDTSISAWVDLTYSEGGTATVTVTSSGYEGHQFYFAEGQQGGASQQSSPSKNVTVSAASPPSYLEVVSDYTSTAYGYAYRTTVYQVKRQNDSNAGIIPICEAPQNSGWSCSGGMPTPATTSCLEYPGSTQSNGRFEDHWYLGPGHTPSGCGYDTTDPWFWDPTSGTSLLGTLSGFIHNDAIRINGVTCSGPNCGMAEGTVIPKQ